jgi:Protein of unknown function (DUF2848)
VLLQFGRFAKDRTDHVGVEINSLIIAGWAGRNATAIEHHIEELAALGIPRPSMTPLYYRVAAQTLTQASRLVVLGPDSSGEVEPVVVATADGLWIGIGSDHTDRKAEASGIALSKQLCGKPVGTQLWSYADVEEHWDEMVIRSWAQSMASGFFIRTARFRRCERLAISFRDRVAEIPFRPVH